MSADDRARRINIEDESPASHPLNELSMGLDSRLHWGMTTAEAKRIYPTLKLEPFGPTPSSSLDAFAGSVAWGPSLEGVATYEHAGCSFDLRLAFYQNRLDRISLTIYGRQADRCRGQVERELLAQYGPEGGTRSSGRNFAQGSWHTPPIGYVHYEFRGAADIHLLDVTFSDDNNFSPRRLAECQSIAVDVESIEHEVSPILADLPYLGCEYPPISVRLQEEGAVVLNVEVLADGTVGNVDVSSPSRAMRLNDAAVRIAHDKLQFSPATRDGKPVGVTKQMSINFRITHPIRGTQ